MYKSFTTMILGATLAAAQTQAPAQPTAAELLQKGIYTQETVGDLDGAIKIYHQIVDSHPTQREIAAQAQYRLGLTLLAKGDAALASQEIQRLGWDFPDYKELIASAKNAGGAAQTGPFRTFVYRAGPGLQEASIHAERPYHDAEFDFTKSVTVTGTVLQVQWLNPYVWLTVNSNGNAATQYRISLAPPNVMVRDGWTKDRVKAGDQVTFVGAPALDGSSEIQATSVSANGVVIFMHSTAATK